MSIPLTNEGAALLLDNAKDGQYVLSGDRAAFTHGTFYVVFSDSTKSGRVDVEVGPHVGFPGKWALIGSVPWLASGAAWIVPITGPHLAIRFRLIDVIGGTVSLYGVAQ